MRRDLCATVNFCIVVVLWSHFKIVMYIFEQATVRYNFNWSVCTPLIMFPHHPARKKIDFTV
jgi:hypothetical protein